MVLLLVASLVSSAVQPAAVPTPSAPTPPPIVSAAEQQGTPDALTQLSNAMNLALPEQQRLEAVAALGQLREPRLLPVLSYLMQDRSRPVRRAAVVAVSALPSDPAQELLVGCVRNTQLPFDAREECVRALHVQGLPSAPDRLEQLSRESQLTGTLIALARTELKTHYPDRVETQPQQVAAGAQPGALPFKVSGRQTLMAAGATYGAYTLYALGDIGRTESGPALGLIGGAALGGTAGYLLGKDFTQARSLTLSTGTGLGLWAGLGVGLAALSPTEERRYLNFFALGGEALGALGSWYLWDTLGQRLEVTSPNADPWITPTAIMLTTPTLHLLSQINNDDGRIQGLGLTSGIVLGGTLGMLLRHQVTDGRGSYLATGTGWSMGLGALGQLGSTDHPTVERTELVMLGAGLAGLTLAQLTWTPELKPGDIATINGFAVGGAALGGGLIFLGEEDKSDQATARILMATTAAGLVGGRLLTERLHFSAGDSSLLGLGLAQGTVTGAMLPGFFEEDPDGRSVASGMLLGSSLGTLATVGLTQVTEYTPAEVGRMAVIDLFGSMAGVGTVMMLREDQTSERDVQRGLLIGSLASLAASSQLTSRMEVSRGDAALVGLGSSWGAWQGLGLAIGLEASGEVKGGATLLGLGLGGLGGLGLSQVVEVSPYWVAAASSGSLWGGWLMSSAHLAWGELEAPGMLLVVAAGDVGLALSTLALSPLVGATPTQLGIVSLGGLGGGVLFTLGGGLFTRESRPLLQASFIGTGVGLLVGGIIASRINPEPDTQVSARRLSGGTAGPSVSFRGLSSAPLFSPDGRSRGVAVVASFEND
ncbi:MAG TPA: HEAT repeat domain-containing protein [Myxococcaceae bacterium]|jgi:hypothetical protein